MPVTPSALVEALHAAAPTVSPCMIEEAVSALIADDLSISEAHAGAFTDEALRLLAISHAGA
jgi:hypothetical protein